MRFNLVGAFVRNAEFGTECAFAKGFDRLGGHQITKIDTSYPDQKWDYDADVTIVWKWMEGSYWKDLERCGGIKIVYQPDDIRFPHIQEMMRGMRRYCDYAFMFDNTGAEIARNKFGFKKAVKLLLTADDDLYAPPDPFPTKDVDLCFVGSFTAGPNHASRRKMVQILCDAGFDVAVLTECFDIPRIVNLYARSKIVLNHGTDVGLPFGNAIGMQCRHFESGFVKSCLLSNWVAERDLVNYHEFRDETDLVANVINLLNDPSEREYRAQALYDELKASHRPEHRAQQIIDFVGSL